MPVTFPFTLTNGTSADADQVMADLNALKTAVDAAAVPRFQTHTTDTNLTVTSVAPFETVLSTGLISAARTVTLSTAGALAGSRFHIVRSGVNQGNAFNVGTSPVKALTLAWCEVTFNGTAWVLSAYGLL